jgi:1-acyl-sn-glycerol-3-phosphate acyltransferase
LTRPGPLNAFFQWLARLLARLLLRLTVQGTGNIPTTGPLLITMNHLGGADPVLVIGHTPRAVSVTGKSEIMGWPVLGSAARAYGMIPVRRGEVDRSALNQLLGVLRSGQALLIAPEGRESLTGALEQGKGGPAFLAQQAEVPILPVAITGTAWRSVLPAWRNLRRPCVTLTFGQPYRLEPGTRRRDAADIIMRQIAALLPPEYRGVYAADLAEVD